MEPKSTELFREGNFVYHVLTPKYRDEVHMVLSRAFCSEPISYAIGEIRPELRPTLAHWVEFMEFWMDHCSTNGLSVIALDEVNHRVAGAFIVRELMMMPDEFVALYKTEGHPLTPFLHLLWDFDAAATKLKPELTDEGKAVDLWMLGVHPDYRGNKIANHMMGAVLPLIKKAGYKYGTIEATSAFTSKAAEHNGFTKLYEMKVCDWLWKGEPLYTNAKPPHGTWAFWVKELYD